MKNGERKNGESSFSLIEAVIALGLMAIILLEVTKVQGHAINFSSYERKVTQAIWLAKAVMGHVEYSYTKFPIKDLKVNQKEADLPEELCPKDTSFDCNYKYSVSIEEWKLPILDMTAASLGDPSLADIVKTQVKQFLGDEILKVAYVEISWPEGSRKESVGLPYLMTAQMNLDKTIETLQPVGTTGTGTETKTETVVRTDTDTDTRL